MIDNFEGWSEGELLSLFVSGCISELVQEHKLSPTALLAFPVLSVDGMVMYQELLDTGYYPEKSDWKRVVKYLRQIGERNDTEVV